MCDDRGLLKIILMILISIFDCDSNQKKYYMDKRAEFQIPYIPSIAPLITCRAAASYTCRVVVVGPKTRSAYEFHITPR
jgi:hypothetical protein